MQQAVVLELQKDVKTAQNIQGKGENDILLLMQSHSYQDTNPQHGFVLDVAMAASHAWFRQEPF